MLSLNLYTGTQRHDAARGEAFYGYCSEEDVASLRKEGIDAVRYVLWDATGLHRDFSLPAWRNQATEEQKRIGWEMAVRIEKILCTVLHKAHRLQVEEKM